MPPLAAWPRSQLVIPSSRAASKAILNTCARLAASSSVSRSASSVPRPARFSVAATNWLRGLCLLLPLPWAKTTSPGARPGMTSDPGSRTPPASIAVSAGSASPSRVPACAISPPPPPPPGYAAAEVPVDALVTLLRALDRPYRTNHGW